MKKRRRAYKAYDWRTHQWQLILNKTVSEISRRLAQSMDMAILFGKDKVSSVEPVRIQVPDYLLDVIRRKDAFTLQKGM